MTVKPRVVGGALLLIVAMAGGLAAKFEGNPRTSYMDNLPATPTPTACRGHTGADVRVGRAYSPEQCAEWFRADLLKAANGVQGCVTEPMAPNQFAAYTSTAYNIGIAAFCRSSMARLANTGDRDGSCRAILLYVYAGGHKLRGLVRRRQAEYELCVRP
jgi:lysozyme